MKFNNFCEIEGKLVKNDGIIVILGFDGYYPEKTKHCGTLQEAFEIMEAHLNRMNYHYYKLIMNAGARYIEARGVEAYLLVKKMLELSKTK